MALVTEDGSGQSTAESYISVAAADTYHDNRGNTTWLDITTAQKEEALRRATDYMVAVYRLRWKGVRMTATQALDWPRGYVYTQPFLNGATTDFPYLVANNIVPTDIARAAAEFALLASAGDLSPPLGRPTIQETVGPITVRYADNSRQTTTYRALDDMLRPYLQGEGGNSARVVRV
jgi:hypothetical protein